MGTAPAATMRSTALLGALEGVDDLAGRQPDVAAIDQAQGRHRIEVGVGRVEAAHQRRLLAHRIRAAARADAHVGAAVERDAQDRRLVGRARPAIGRAHEGHGRGEESVFGKPFHGHCPAVRKSKAVRVWILATARSSSTRTYSSGPPMLKGVSPSTTVGTPLGRYQRESEPADPHVHRRRLAQHLGGDRGRARDDLVAGIGEGGLEAADGAPAHTLQRPQPFVELLDQHVGRDAGRAGGCRRGRGRGVGTRLGEAPPSMVPIFTVTRCRVSDSPAPDRGSEILGLGDRGG